MAKKDEEEEVLKLLGKNFKIKYFDEEEVNLNRIIEVRNSSIEDDLEQLPNILQSFGILQAKALKKLRAAETQYKIWTATADKEYRLKKARKEEKFTEKQLENEIITQPEYLEWKSKIHLLEEKYEQLRAIYWALQKKSEVLIELTRQRGQINKLNKMEK